MKHARTLVPVCRVDGCRKAAAVKGKCHAHYKAEYRARRKANVKGRG